MPPSYRLRNHKRVERVEEPERVMSAAGQAGARSNTHELPKNANEQALGRMLETVTRSSQPKPHHGLGVGCEASPL